MTCFESVCNETIYTVAAVLNLIHVALLHTVKGWVEEDIQQRTSHTTASDGIAPLAKKAKTDGSGLSSWTF